MSAKAVSAVMFVLLGSCMVVHAETPAAPIAAPKHPVMKLAPSKSNGSGIALSYSVDGTPRVGQSVRVVMQLDGIIDSAGGTLRISADAGLAVAPSVDTVVLPAGEVTTLSFAVTPSTTGTAYVHVFTTQHGATSAVSIPIQTGKAVDALPKSSAMKEGGAGEKMIVLPAR